MIHIQLEKTAEQVSPVPTERFATMNWDQSQICIHPSWILQAIEHTISDASESSERYHFWIRTAPRMIRQNKIERPMMTPEPVACDKSSTAILGQAYPAHLEKTRPRGLTAYICWLHGFSKGSEVLCNHSSIRPNDPLSAWSRADISLRAMLHRRVQGKRAVRLQGKASSYPLGRS